MSPAELTSTTPGSRWVAGSMTATPYTSGNTRSAMRSLSTPFWAQNTATPGGATRARSVSAPAVCWALHGQDDDVAGGERQLAGVPDRGDGQRHRPARRPQRQPVRLQGPEVVAPGDERHVVAGLEQPAADGAPDGPGPVDHESHLPRMPERRRAYAG